MTTTVSLTFSGLCNFLFTSLSKLDHSDLFFIYFFLALASSWHRCGARTTLPDLAEGCPFRPKLYLKRQNISKCGSCACNPHLPENIYLRAVPRYALDTPRSCHQSSVWKTIGMQQQQRGEKSTEFTSVRRELTCLFWRQFLPWCALRATAVANDPSRHQHGLFYVVRDDVKGPCQLGMLPGSEITGTRSSIYCSDNQATMSAGWWKTSISAHWTCLFRRQVLALCALRAATAASQRDSKKTIF